MHPENGPKHYNGCNQKELDEAIENASKFHHNQGLLNDAIYESDDTIPKTQMGTILLFPEITEEDKERMEGFITKVFGEMEARLAKEYDEPSDPTMFWEYGCDGMHFDGKTVNPNTREHFGRNSPSIYVAGCKDSTSDYLIESAIDRMFDESAILDRKIKKESEKINFKRFRSFLVYNIGSKRFYQLGMHGHHVYRKPPKEASDFDAKVYDLFLPSQRNAF